MRLSVTSLSLFGFLLVGFSSNAFAISDKDYLENNQAIVTYEFELMSIGNIDMHLRDGTAYGGNRTEKESYELAMTYTSEDQNKKVVYLDENRFFFDNDRSLLNTRLAYDANKGEYTLSTSVSNEASGAGPYFGLSLFNRTPCEATSKTLPIELSCVSLSNTINGKLVTRDETG